MFILQFILVVSLVQYKSLHESSNGRLPVSADGIGWMLTALSFIQVPIWALVVIFTRKDCNTFGKVSEVMYVVRLYGIF